MTLVTTILLNYSEYTQDAFYFIRYTEYTQEAFISNWLYTEIFLNYAD